MTNKPLRHATNWLRIDQTQALIAEIEKSIPGIPGIEPIQAVASRQGPGGGTYVVKELVYGYAMWISPRFHLQVIRAFDAMQSQPHPAPPDINSVARWNAVHPGNRWILMEIPRDAAILPHREWPGVIRTTDFPRDLLPEVLTAVSERMKGLPPPAQGRAERNFAPRSLHNGDGRLTPYSQVLDKLEEAGIEGISSGRLANFCWLFRNLSAKARGELIEQMLADEAIVEVVTKPTGRGRPSKRLVHIKFIKKEALDG